MENYVLYDELGRGAYSVVYKGRKKGSVEYVAVHCAEKTKRKELQNVVRLTHELSHDNIVTFYEWYETTNHIWMITELCTGQSLSVMLEQDGCLSEVTIRSFGVDIASGLHYLHDLGILYCDLRCSKLILDGYGRVKLSNFSLAKVEGESELNEGDSEANEESRRPSPMYMAPEVLQGYPHSVSSDLWSFGCVLYELFTGCLPFEADSFSELVNKVLTENLLYPLQVINGVELGPSDEFYGLVQALVCKDEGARLTWSELLQHAFWEGALGVSGDDTDTEQEESINRDEQEKPALVEREEKEALNDDDHVFKKQDLGKTVVMVQGENRPESAPESSKTGIRHGTYKVEQSRPRTTQSDNGKIRKLTKGVNENKHTVSASVKSNSPRKKPNAKKVVGDVSSDNDKVQNCRTSQVSQPDRGYPVLDSISTSDIENLLYHPSDFIVSSIIDNPKIKKTVVPKWDAKTMGMTPMTMDQLLSASADEQTKYFNEISKMLEQAQRASSHSGGPSQRSKLHCASYLASIFQNTDIANLVANSSLVAGLLQVIKHSSSADLKARLGNGTELACFFESLV